MGAGRMHGSTRNGRRMDEWRNHRRWKDGWMDEPGMVEGWMDGWRNHGWWKDGWVEEPWLVGWRNRGR